MKAGEQGKPVVVKVGGSLLAWSEFPDRMREFLDKLGNVHVILVVGGGATVDLVRDLDAAHRIGECRSHSLALRALDLTSHILAALIPGLEVVTNRHESNDAHVRGKIPVLSPLLFMTEIDIRSAKPLKESWDVTTDSIAARLAEYLGAERLILLKSVGINGARSRLEAAATGLVDPAFPEASQLLERVEIVNLRDENMPAYSI